MCHQDCPALAANCACANSPVRKASSPYRAPPAIPAEAAGADSQPFQSDFARHLIAHNLRPDPKHGPIAHDLAGHLTAGEAAWVSLFSLIVGAVTGTILTAWSLA